MKLSILQIVISVLLVILILLQERSAGMSGLFGGGGDGGGAYQTRRGIERGIFWGTIVLGLAFGVVAILQILR